MLLLTRRIVLIFKIGAWRVSKIAMPKWTIGEFILCVKVKKKKKKTLSCSKVNKSTIQQSPTGVGSSCILQWLYVNLMWSVDSISPINFSSFVSSSITV